MFPSVETVFPARVGVLPATLTRPAALPGRDTPQEGQAMTMTDRKDDQDAMTDEQAPAEPDYLDIPMISRRSAGERDAGGYLSKPSLWSRLCAWFSGS